MQLDKFFDFLKDEKNLYSQWEQSNCFKPQKGGEPYSIMMPPPNVTGSLHMGHALTFTIQDILIRYHRMKGMEVLWQAGTDHAGIATQMVVERKLSESNLDRRSLGREKFIEKVWEWKKESGGQISNQLRRLGASADWSRERFTMDEGLSNAVKKVFVNLFNDGIIYKDKRLVNWDPKLLTAISDLEVEQRDTEGSLWHIKYPIDENNHIIVATTRPETMLGDTAVAVHPDDEKYKNLIGKFCNLPISNKKIPIIADEYADPEKGSGAVKITPAHDFNDFEVGKRHDLEFINIFDENAKLNSNVPEEFQNLDRFEARKLILKKLDEMNLLIKEEKQQMVIPYGDRSGVVIEPWLTDQWFCDAKKLSVDPISAVRDNSSKFIPKQWENTFYNWMENIQPWCISRQLWWGHQIPAWYGPDKKIFVALNEKEAKQNAKKFYKKEVELERDPDVLDTWFSSGLWPFATLGWPDKKDFVKKFYPTTVLVTGFDIIFFWVARMMMFGMEFLNKEPFKDIYVHALVRDEKGQKMSKSKGNIIDPIDVIDGIPLKTLIAKRTENLIVPSLREKIERSTKKEFPSGIPSFGTDALRLTFASLASGSRDINFDVKRVEGYSNFCNKLWNASRFIKLQCKGYKKSKKFSDDPIDKWIRSEFNKSLESYVDHIDNSRFDLATQVLYEFIWEKLCDWYIEFCKIRLNDQSISNVEKAQIKNSLLDIFEVTTLIYSLLNSKFTFLSLVFLVKDINLPII